VRLRFLTNYGSACGPVIVPVFKTDKTSVPRVFQRFSAAVTACKCIIRTHSGIYLQPGLQ
jgi:hypothetical protein